MPRGGGYATTPSEIQRVAIDERTQRLAAEAKIERVRALVDEWEAKAGPGTDTEKVFGKQLIYVEFAVEKIREALDLTTEQPSD